MEGHKHEPIRLNCWNIEWRYPRTWIKLLIAVSILITGYISVILFSAIITNVFSFIEEHDKIKIFGILSVFFSVILAIFFNIMTGIRRNMFSKFNALFDKFGFIDMLFILALLSIISTSVILLTNISAELLSLEGNWQSVIGMSLITIIICFPGVVEFITRHSQK